MAVINYCGGVHEMLLQEIGERRYVIMISLKEPKLLGLNLLRLFVFGQIRALIHSHKFELTFFCTCYLGEIFHYKYLIHFWR